MKRSIKFNGFTPIPHFLRDRRFATRQRFCRWVVQGNQRFEFWMDG